MTAPADNTSWRTAGPNAWHYDTTDVLHCSMPPQVRRHIEELRAEVVRLTREAQQVEVMHSSTAVLGYAVLSDFPDDPTSVPNPYFWDDLYPTVEAAQDAILDMDAGTTHASGGRSVVAVVRVGADGRIGGTP